MILNDEKFNRRISELEFEADCDVLTRFAFNIDLQKSIDLDDLVTDKCQTFKKDIQAKLSKIIDEIYLFAGADLSLLEEPKNHG